MDTSTVTGAVSDALAGLPAGTSSFINANIGTPAGQQAILAAGTKLGLSQAQIAAAVSQATGQTITPQQVAAVAAQAPAQAPAQVMAATPNGLVASGYTAPAAITPQVQQQSLGNDNPMGTSTAQSSTPANLLSQYDQSTQAGIQRAGLDSVMNLVNSGASASSLISQGYTPQAVTQPYKDASGNLVTPAPNTYSITKPDGSGGSLNYYFTADPQTGATSPVSNPSQNLTYTPGSGGGALSGLLTNPFVQLAASLAIPGAAPIIAGANAVNAAANGNTLGALVNGGIAAYTGGLFDGSTGSTGSTLANTGSTGNFSSTIGDTGNLGNTNYGLGGTDVTGSTGTGLQGTTGSGLNLYQPGAIDPATGIPYTGEGLATSGSTNLSDMGGGQGLTIPASTGSSAVSNAVLGAAGATNLGTGNLPVNTLTGQTLGNAVANTNTGVTTPSSAITNTAGNVVGTPAGTNTSNGVITPTTGTGSSGLSKTTLAGLAVPAIASTLGTLSTNNAISNAANTQAGAATNVQNILTNLYNQQQGLQQPYQQLGTNAANAIGANGQYFTNQFNNQDLNAQLAPNYAFQLQQGLGQAQNAANATGGLLSGNTLQGLNTYAQNYAQSAYQNAFNNYQTQRNNIYNNLSNAAGLGQTSNQQLSSLGGQLANTYGQVTTGLAATQAGAQTAQAVNNANLLSNLANTATVAALA